MQFAVPQFTDVEDRLIGSLTLKQFLVLLGTGGLVTFFWSVLGPSFLFFILSLPIAVVGIAAALGKYNGRSMFSYVVPFASFLTSTRVMVFKREADAIAVSSTTASVVKKQTKPEDLEPAESRLKKLAYLLDKKAAEEGDMAGNDVKRSVVSTSPVNLTDYQPIQPPKPQKDSRKERLLQAARQLDGIPTEEPRQTSIRTPKKPGGFDPSSIIK